MPSDHELNNSHLKNNVSFWLETHGISLNSDLSKGHKNFDVTVVGAGLAGICTAYFLQQGGLKVAVVDANGVCEGASGRNAGHALELGVEYASRDVALHGAEKFGALAHFTFRNCQLLRDIIKAENINCDYLQNGYKIFASNETEAEELKQSAEVLKQIGLHDHIFYANPEDPQDYQFSKYGVKVSQREAILHPAKFVRTLAQICQQRGVELLFPVKAKNYRLQSGEIILSTDSLECPEITSSLVINCTNAYSPLWLDFFANKITPTRGQCLATSPIQDVYFSRCMSTNYGFEYWDRTAMGNLIFGGWRHGSTSQEKGLYEHQTNPEIHQGLAQFMRTRFPLRGEDINCKITHAWTGIMGMSIDGLPMMGHLPGNPNIWTNAAFTGHGFGFAILGAKTISDLILQQPLDDEAKKCLKYVDPRRFG